MPSLQDAINAAGGPPALNWVQYHAETGPTT